MENLDYKNCSFEQIFEGVYGYKKPYNPMKADLKDRVALVTGATGMIGSASAELLASSGAKIALWGRNDAKGQKVESKIKEAGGYAKYYHVDVVDRALIENAVKEVIQDFGRIDILFANAGNNFSNRRPVTEYDSGMFDQNIEINLNNSSVYLAKLVLPYMLAQGGGNIIFTSSICGVYGLRNQSGFVASKFAICALTRSLALEYAKYNIRVNTLAPGSLPEPESKLNVLWSTCNFDDYDSNFNNPATIVYDIPARRPAYPTDMAGIILYFASDDASYTTGQVVVVDGGWTAGFSGDY
jgi:NAD(P)-dependent dehydrogenase (short-subunit alcohol dehydrogenase family)